MIATDYRPFRVELSRIYSVKSDKLCALKWHLYFIRLPGDNKSNSFSTECTYQTPYVFKSIKFEKSFFL